MGKDTAAAFAPSELRRDISVWGSYMWGYADIGADIYTALGIVALAALGRSLSSLVNGVLGVVTMAVQSLIVVGGFVLVWRPEMLVHQLVFNPPTLGQFAFGTSLAIISFVGLESISQVAQETRRPATIIPRTSIGLILSVLLFAIAFSILATGMIDPSAFKGHEGHPVSRLAS